jgi:hypothetical protein
MLSLIQLCAELWREDSGGVRVAGTVPVFGQHLLTVEQLTKVKVDADIQSAVNEFLKGLTTQMFAR